MTGPLRKQNSRLFLDNCELVPDIDQTLQNIPPPGSCKNEASLRLKRRGHESMTVSSVMKQCMVRSDTKTE